MVTPTVRLAMTKVASSCIICRRISSTQTVTLLHTEPDIKSLVGHAEVTQHFGDTINNLPGCELQAECFRAIQAVWSKYTAGMTVLM